MLVFAILLALPAQAQQRLVAASHPLAAQAGMQVLREGGSAVDAAIAIQAVLTLVEPQSSGIGGGALLLHWDAARRDLSAWDGRETAPAAATPGLFLRDGRPLFFHDAAVGGRAVGVPGTVRMLEAVHREHGRLPLPRLLAPAITLAEQGFPVSVRLAAQISAESSRLSRDPAARDHFLPGGRPVREGEVLRNPALAATLRALAQRGANALHEGPIAAAIAAAVQASPNRGGLTEQDLAAYQPKRRTPVCAPYRAHVVCGFPPPSSGGVAIGQILGLLAHHEMAALDPRGVDAAHLLGEAGRLAFADRNRYLADADFVPVPVAGLLNPAYLTARAQLMDRDRALVSVRPGNPPWAPLGYASQPPQREGGTAHMSIRDAAGNMVSMTTTIEDVFGARLMVGGFLLNNELTDFAFQPEQDGRPVANRVEPGKRPRSSMSPTLVFDARGEPVAAVGSAGGARIIGHVAGALVALLDWGMSAQEAAARPHTLAVDNRLELEAGTQAAGLSFALEQRGFPVEVRSIVSGLNILRRTPQGWQGGSDPRREGVVLAE